MPAALTLILALFIGVTFGIVIAAMVSMAKERGAEKVGAGELANVVLEVIGKWEGLGWDGVSPTRHECVDAIYHIKMHCMKASIEAAEHEEKNYTPDSTNG